jgi:hypothetical protein
VIDEKRCTKVNIFAGNSDTNFRDIIHSCLCYLGITETGGKMIKAKKKV